MPQAFFDNGAISIVMEFMDKGSLADVLKQRKKVGGQPCMICHIATLLL